MSFRITNLKSYYRGRLTRYVKSPVIFSAFSLLVFVCHFLCLLFSELLVFHFKKFSSFSLTLEGFLCLEKLSPWISLFTIFKLLTFQGMWPSYFGVKVSLKILHRLIAPDWHGMFEKEVVNCLLGMTAQKKVILLELFLECK